MNATRIEALLNEMQNLLQQQEQLSQEFQAIVAAYCEWLPTHEAAEKLNRPQTNLRRLVREGYLDYGIHYRNASKGYEFNLLAMQGFFSLDPATLPHNLESA